MLAPASSVVRIGTADPYSTPAVLRRRPSPAAVIEVDRNKEPRMATEVMMTHEHVLMHANVSYFVHVSDAYAMAAAGIRLAHGNREDCRNAHDKKDGS